MPKQLPWQQIRAAYIEGHAVDPDGQPFSRSWPTLDEVATVFGANGDNVKARSARERWVEQREAFQLEAETQRRRWVLEQRVDRATRVDDRGLSAAEAGLALIGIRLTRLVRSQEQLPAADRGVGVDFREMAGLGLAAKRFLDVKAHVMGQPSTRSEEGVDELELSQRVEERKLAESLAAFLAARRSEDAPAS